jgi:hypothetical protein
MSVREVEGTEGEGPEAIEGTDSRNGATERTGDTEEAGAGRAALRAD